MSEEKKGMGCFAKGCIVTIILVFVLGVTGGLVVYYKAGDWTRRGIAFGVDKGAEAMFDGLKLPADEKKAALEAIKDFSDRIRNNKITMEQGTKLGQKLMEGPLPIVIACRAFEVMYLQKSKLDEAAKKQAHIDVTRFAHGLANKKIDRDKAKPIMDVVCEPNPSNPKQKKLKNSITDDELKQCLKIMKEESDKAGIANKEYKIDIAAEIRKAITEGLKKK